MAEKKKLSTAEILAAARGGKAPPPPAAPAEGADDAPAAAAAAEPSGDAASPPPAKPAAKPAAAAAGGRPSVADILAMARAKKADGEAPAVPKAAAAKPAAAKPAAEKPAAKPAAKAGAKGADAKPAAPMARDTASILAAARAGAKPGPVSKAEAPAPVRPAARPPAERAGAADKPAAAKPALPALPPKPVKADAAKKGAGKGGDEESRRGFLEMAVGSFMAAGFTALSVTGGLFTLGLARFLFPNVLAEPPSRFKVGFKEAFPSGKVETKYVAQYGVWVVNSDVGGTQQIYALKTVCTHLGCTPNWLEAEQKFKCPCHGSGFYKDGVNFEGPAPRPLERYAIKVADDGQLEIDKSRSYHEELGQWADPESFIPV